MSRFHQYVNAYKKDNLRYTYWMDDGTKALLVAGRDGVTEAWIARLKAWHREERRSMRRGEALRVSLEAYCAALGDCSGVLVDEASDPARAWLAQAELFAMQRKINQALASLSPAQRVLLRRVRIDGETLTAIAREQGVSKTAIFNRMAKIDERIKKVLAGSEHRPRWTVER